MGVGVGESRVCVRGLHIQEKPQPLPGLSEEVE